MYKSLAGLPVNDFLNSKSKSNKMKKLASYILIFLAIAVTACKKEPEPTRTDLAVAKWQLSALYRNGDKIAGPGTDYLLEMRADGTYSNTEVNGFNHSGTWSIADGDGRLVLKSTVNGDMNFVIILMDRNNLTIEMTQESGKNEDDAPGTFRYVLTRVTR
jgi:hypothetical protein